MVLTMKKTVQIASSKGNLAVQLRKELASKIA